MKKLANALTSASARAQGLYCSLLTALQRIGPFNEEVKKTSVHLVRGSAFAGVQFRREYLILTIKSAAAIESPRVSKCEQVSKNRWHCEVKVARETELDRQVVGWLKVAYEQCA